MCPGNLEIDIYAFIKVFFLICILREMGYLKLHFDFISMLWLCGQYFSVCRRNMINDCWVNRTNACIVVKTFTNKMDHITSF
jgi:hypothetical protein